jgi:hypothetical protein
LESYGVWDLIYRYLLPGWWIIPVYTSLTAWVATILWWRRALVNGRAWADRVLQVLANGPKVREFVMRIAMAVPLLLIPVFVLAIWYLFGSLIWYLDANRDAYDAWSVGLPPGFSLQPNWINVAALSYAAVGIGLVGTQRRYRYAGVDTTAALTAPVLWFTAPAMLVSVCLGTPLLTLLLGGSLDPVFASGSPGAGTIALLLGGVVIAAALPLIGFLLGAWCLALGWRLLVDGLKALPRPRRVGTDG